MGFLNNIGETLGAGFAGPGTADALARRSLGLGALATGLDMSAQVAQGVEAYSANQYRAKLLGEAAGSTRLAGQYAESALKGRFTRLEADQKVAQAANGIDVNSTSAQAVRQATADVGAMDAAMLHYNAAREAFGYEESAALARRAGTNALVKGAVGAGVTFLGGASSLADKWRTYQYSGALKNG